MAACIDLIRLHRVPACEANQAAAYLAGQPPWVKGAGHYTLQQDIGALQVTVQQTQGVKVLHPLRDVRQAQ